MKQAGLEQFSRVVALIHEAGLDTARWPEALASVMHLLEADKGGIIDLEGTTLIALTGVGHDPATQKLYAEHYFAIDPTLPVCLNAPPFQATLLHEHFPAPVRATSEYFAFARAHDIGDVIGVSTRHYGVRRSILSLQRHVEAADFDSDAKTLFGLLAPHIDAAKRVQQHLGEALNAHVEIAAAFDKFEAAVFMVDGATRIRHLNASATALLAKYPVVDGRQGKLSFVEPKLSSAFKAAVRRAANELGTSTVLPLHLGEKEPAEIVIAPLQATNPLVATWRQPLALVSISHPRPDAQSISWRMQQLYKLTPTEGALIGMLALGRTVEEIAKAHGVQDATVRTQLRNIFSKTGVSRQADLVRLALTGSAVRASQIKGA